MLIHILITDTYKGGTDVRLFISKNDLMKKAKDELSNWQLRKLKDSNYVTYGDEDQPSTMSYQAQEI
jgi:hypothetical protein